MEEGNDGEAKARNLGPMLLYQRLITTEGFERFIEDQAFSQSYDLAPPYPPPPLPYQ
jgi:hypothetical protein